ncbi:MAG TPA: hypothetical protein ENH10_06650, partial [Bacteroidetes bacterium]|nr:hypothetical protein [Bacteroidota bacterium]HEX04821.1 hypothetical protein [Bacteroidota bacterium]
LAAETAPLVKGLAIGFALEVEDALDNAREKLKRKSLDAILFNRDSNIGSEECELTWVSTQETLPLGEGSKRELAERVMRQVASMLDRA